MIAVGNFPRFSVEQIVNHALIVRTSEHNVGLAVAIDDPERVEYPVLEFDERVEWRVDTQTHARPVLDTQQIETLLTKHAYLTPIVRIDHDFVHHSVLESQTLGDLAKCVVFDERQVRSATF